MVLRRKHPAQREHKYGRAAFDQFHLAPGHRALCAQGKRGCGTSLPPETGADLHVRPRDITSTWKKWLICPGGVRIHGQVASVFTNEVDPEGGAASGLLSLLSLSGPPARGSIGGVQDNPLFGGSQYCRARIEQRECVAVCPGLEQIVVVPAARIARLSG